MKKTPSRPVQTSLFGFHEQLVSICSYVPKTNKSVNLISTVHYSKICKGEAQKPEAILFYNQNKAGVDTMDQMATHFSTKRPSKRWTFAFFCNMLDIMALAAFCVCREIDGLSRNDARRTFLTTLHNTLVLPNIENRMNNVSVISRFSTHLALHLAVEAFFGRPIGIGRNSVVTPECGPSTLTSKIVLFVCRQTTRYVARLVSSAKHVQIAYVNNIQK